VLQMLRPHQTDANYHEGADSQRFVRRHGLRTFTRSVAGGSLACLVVLLLWPQLFAAEPGWAKKHLGWARVLTGDEPHYLVLVNSILNDGDLDLKNNYESVLEGSQQAGARFAFSNLDHHVSYYINGERRVWAELFVPNMFYWPRGANGHRVPLLRPGVDRSLATVPEYSSHPVGVAFLLAPFLVAFRNTRMLEPVAILLSGLSTVFAMLLYRRMLFKFTSDRFAIYLCLFGVFLGTPIWYYSRTFFNEPFILLAVVGLYALSVTRKNPILTGSFLAAGMLMKPQLLLLSIPLLIPDLIRRDWKRIVGLLVMPFLAGLVILYWNHHMYGSLLRGPYPFYRGNILSGAWGLVFSQKHGLLSWAPALFLGVLGWRSLIKSQPGDAAMAGIGFLIIFALTSWWAYWDGGYCFGPRLIVPILPLLGLGLVMVPGLRFFQNRPSRLLLVAIVAISIAINYAAVRRYWDFVGDTASLASVVLFWTGN